MKQTNKRTSNMQLTRKVHQTYNQVLLLQERKKFVIVCQCQCNDLLRIVNLLTQIDAAHNNSADDILNLPLRRESLHLLTRAAREFRQI